MSSSTLLRCSRCFRKAPHPGSPELEVWGAGALEEVEGAALGLVLCPECREEAKADEELGGEG